MAPAKQPQPDIQPAETKNPSYDFTYTQNR